MDIDILSYGNDDERCIMPETYGEPILTKLGGKTDLAAICAGVTSLRIVSDECKENIAQIDCYYQTPSVQFVHAVFMIPLTDLITITELYELVALRHLGEYAYTSELPHAGS